MHRQIKRRYPHKIGGTLTRQYTEMVIRAIHEEDWWYGNMQKYINIHRQVKTIMPLWRDTYFKCDYAHMLTPLGLH